MPDDGETQRNRGALLTYAKTRPPNIQVKKDHSRVAISLDHTRAKEILFSQAKKAREEKLSKLASAWKDRVAQLGLLCPHGKSSTLIAALGTALLAKATDSEVDGYSLLDRGEAAHSYSARSLADNVWARHRADLDIDFGANGANPLNNTPFIGKTRIDEISGVRNREGWKCFLECMKAAESLASSNEAKEALIGFIVARSRSLLPPLNVDVALGDHLLQTVLATSIDAFVAEDSEGGRRAQAAAAAMLDAAFGSNRVVAGVINDPDRHAPLDVSVGLSECQDDGFLIAFEVKDKPIQEHHIRSSIEKTVKDHSLRNLAFVAVSKQQRIVDFDEVVRWAAKRAIKITVFLDWRTLYLACKCFAPADETVFEGKVFRRILARGADLGVSRTALESLHKLGLPIQEKNS